MTRLPPETIDRILELARQGKSLRAIGREVGATHKGVDKVLRRHGLLPQRPNQTLAVCTKPDFIEDVEWMIADKEWPGEIARRLGYTSVRSVLRALEHEGRADLAAEVRKLDRSSHAYFLSCPWPTDGDRAKKVPA